MKTLCDSIRDFIVSNWILILITIILAIMLILSYMHYPDCSCSIINGIFILFSAVVTSIFAIHKYQSEQRTSRIQKIYFEDALLGQAKAIEAIMSQTNNNFLNVENLCNLSTNILDLKIGTASKINYLNTYFENTLNNIHIRINTADFSKETIAKLIYDSKEYNPLADWINKFEQDSYRFTHFLTSQILLLIPDIAKITDQNIEKFKEHLKSFLYNYTQENYTLIRRHYILLHLLSYLVLELSSVNYSEIKILLDAFQKDKIKKITRLINKTYNELIAEFSYLDIGKISATDAAKLDTLIKNCLK